LVIGNIGAIIIGKRRKVMRKVKNLVALSVLVCICLLAVQVFAADRAVSVSPVLDRILAKKELVVGTAAGMPPLNMTTKDGRIVGAEVDLVRTFAGAMGVKLTMKPMPFDELLPALDAGKVDMVLSGMTMTPRRNLKTAFAGPYFESGKSILVKTANAAGMNNLVKINSPDKTLVALKGSTSQEFAQELLPKAKLVLVETYDQAVAMVRDDKAMAMIADLPICLVSVYRYPEAGLITLDKPLSYEPIGVALPPNDHLLLNWVQNILNAMDKSGDLKSIMQQWFQTGDWVKQLK
jgi:polar amino acid transport system substrate-binding protein